MMQRYISTSKVRPSTDIQEQKFQLFCDINNLILLFAPVDDHRAIGVVKGVSQTLKGILG